MPDLGTTNQISGRNADRTRTTLMEAGAYWFARKRYEHVNVREIADRARVAPALINRYFGSKALLFRELLAEAGDAYSPLDGDLTLLGTRLTCFMRLPAEEAQASPGGSSLMMLLYALASIDIQDLLIDHVRHVAMRRLADKLEGVECEERAALILGYLVGYLMVRRLTPLTALTAQRLAESIQRCVDD